MHFQLPLVWEAVVLTPVDHSVNDGSSRDDSDSGSDFLVESDD